MPSPLLLLLLPLLPTPLQGAITRNNDFVAYRQCRWSPFTARGWNGLRRTLQRLDSPQMGKMFEYDAGELWDSVTDKRSSLSTNEWLPKWVFTNRGVQVLVAAALLPDKLEPDEGMPITEAYVTAWNVLLCGVFKMYEEFSIVDRLIGSVMGDETEVPLLIDYLFRIVNCLKATKPTSGCPQLCNSRTLDEDTRNCSMIGHTERRHACKLYLDKELDYQPFDGAKLSEVSRAAFFKEMERFTFWQQRVDPLRRVPTEIFAENSNSDFLVRTVMMELIPPDKDERTVVIDPYFLGVRSKYIANGCQSRENNMKPECLYFRALLHSKLVKLQTQLAARRECRCRLGYTWEPDTNSCEESSMGLCGTANPCKNGGQCEIQVVTKTIGGLQGVATQMKHLCKCPPAWQGVHCELENNVCYSLPSSLTCGQYECKRDPDFAEGFVCVCPPELTNRTSPSDPRCTDRNECETEGICLNDGECENQDPGFKCKCHHGYVGPHCELPPEQPTWSEWEQWGSCQMPEAGRECHQLPKQIRERHCQKKGAQQVCIGPSREVRSFCPGQMAEWDTSGCSVHSTASGEGNETGPEEYVLHDFDDFEEFGKFASDEAQVAMDDDLSQYLSHFSLLLASMLVSCLSLLAFVQLYRRVLRYFIRLLARILADRIVSAVAADGATTADRGTASALR